MKKPREPNARVKHYAAKRVHARAGLLVIERLRLAQEATGEDLLQLPELFIVRRITSLLRETGIDAFREQHAA